MFYFSADSSFHPMNFCEKIFDLDKTQFFYEFLKKFQNSFFLRSIPAADDKNNGIHSGICIKTDVVFKSKKFFAELHWVACSRNHLRNKTSF